MALRYKLRQDGDITSVNFLELFDPEDPGSEIQRLAAELHCRLRLYEIDASWNPTTDDIREVAFLAGKYVNIPNSRIAVVANSELVFGLVRMYAGYRGSNPDIPALEVFRKRDQALAWLESQR